MDASVLSLAFLIFAYCSTAWSKPSFINRNLNYIASLHVKISATYSTSIDDKVTVVWRFEH